MDNMPSFVYMCDSCAKRNTCDLSVYYKDYCDGVGSCLKMFTPEVKNRLIEHTIVQCLEYERDSEIVKEWDIW